MTGSSQRRRSSTTTSRNENHRPRQTQQEQSRDGERVWKVRGRPCFKRNARLTHLPSKLSCQGSTSSRAPCRSSRHSPRLRSSPSSSSLVVSRSQGRSQEASLAPRPTSCSPTPSPPSRCPSARSPICQGLPHSRLDSFEKVVFFFGLRFFWLSLLRVFLLCYSSSVGTLYRSRARVEYLARREEILEISKQKFPSREHSW